jgi:putative spermidine/putrescine transport system permease protein
MSTLDGPLGLSWEEIRRSPAVRVVLPRTERGRTRRRIVALAVPFFALAVVGAVVPLRKMIRITTAEQYLTTVSGFQMTAWEGVLYSVFGYIPVVGEPVVRAIALVTHTLPLVPAVDVVRPEYGAVYGVTFWNSLWFGAVTTVCSVAVGVALAHGLEKYDFSIRDRTVNEWIVTLISFPISLPGIVAAFMMIVLFGQTGLLTNFFAVLSGAQPVDIQLTGQPSGSTLAVVGLFFGYLYSMIPRATMLLRGTYAEVNTDAEEAARSLGASPAQTFRYVTFPQIRPGIVGALILAFRTALAIFGTVLVLKALSVVTFRFNQDISVGFELPRASVLATIFFLFTLVFTFAGLRMTSAEVAR